jgi:hypothetical protein
MSRLLGLDLFHYTSIHGVEGILRDREVWASSLHFMNDSQEWSYTFDLANERLINLYSERASRRWPGFLSQLTKTLDVHPRMNVCVFSLSEMQNQLSQWRAYCPREGGYSISFDMKYLLKQLSAQGFRLEKCDYNLRRQRRHIDRTISDSLASAGDLPNKGSLEPIVSKVREKLLLDLVRMAPTLKHPDFSEEREWRAFKIVSYGDENMSHHIKGSVVIPHCRLNLSVVDGYFPVAGVMVGPNPHQTLAYRGVSMMAKKVGVTRIGLSQTPYRNL